MLIKAVQFVGLTTDQSVALCAHSSSCSLISLAEISWGEVGRSATSSKFREPEICSQRKKGMKEGREISEKLYSQRRKLIYYHTPSCLIYRAGNIPYVLVLLLISEKHAESCNISLSTLEYRYHAIISSKVQYSAVPLALSSVHHDLIERWICTCTCTLYILLILFTV